MLTEYIPKQIWLQDYPIRYAGCRFTSRMTVIRLRNGQLMIHSPCEIDATTQEAIEQLGTVQSIIAPGTYHYFHVQSCQAAFPDAKTFICPGLETKCPHIKYDGILSDRPQRGWEADLDMVVVRGNRFISEVAFFHKPTRTLILVDLLENIGDFSQGTNWVLRFYWKFIFKMWNNPKPAPEYQLGWQDKIVARQCLDKILAWDFDRVILAHGEAIGTSAKEILQKAWQNI